MSLKDAWRRYSVGLHMLSAGTEPVRQRLERGETAGVALFFGQKMKIKNWSKFQHFKDRKPPWVKLYPGLMYVGVVVTDR